MLLSSSSLSSESSLDLRVCFSLFKTVLNISCIDLKSFSKGVGMLSPLTSRGVFPFLSKAYLQDPLSNKALTGLVDFKYSTLLTAKCNAVNP